MTAVSRHDRRVMTQTWWRRGFPTEAPRIYARSMVLSATGHELWRDDLGTGDAWKGEFGPNIVAGPASVVVYGASLASAFPAHPIGGDGHQTCEGLAVAADGSATVVVQSAHDSGTAVLRVGSRTFEDDPLNQFFVLNILP